MYNKIVNVRLSALTFSYRIKVKIEDDNNKKNIKKKLMIVMEEE